MKDERALPGFGYKADRNGRFHAAINAQVRSGDASSSRQLCPADGNATFCPGLQRISQRNPRQFGGEARHSRDFNKVRQDTEDGLDRAKEHYICSRWWMRFSLDRVHGRFSKGDSARSVARDNLRAGKASPCNMGITAQTAPPLGPAYAFRPKAAARHSR
jgi:hypothetical protein